MRIGRLSKMHKTESLPVIGHARSMPVCSTVSDWKQRNILVFVHSLLTRVVIRVAPDIISGPGRNPAKFSYPAGRIWARILPSFHASASLCNWAGIHFFTNSVICTSLFQRACGNDVMIQQSGGSTIRSDIQHYTKWLKYTWLLHQPPFHLKYCSVLHSWVMWCSLGLQLKNIWLQPRPRPDLQSQIRPNQAPVGFEKNQIRCNPSCDMFFRSDARSLRLWRMRVQWELLRRQLQLPHQQRHVHCQRRGQCLRSFLLWTGPFMLLLLFFFFLHFENYTVGQNTWTQTQDL